MSPFPERICMKGYMSIPLSRYIIDSDESVIGSRQFTGAVRAARSIVSDRLAAEGAQARIYNRCRFGHQTIKLLDDDKNSEGNN